MTSQQQRPVQQWTPAWVAVVAAAVAVVAVVGVQAKVLPLSGWGFPVFGVLGAVACVLFGLMDGALLRTHAARTVGWLAAGGWVWWALREGWSDRVWLALFGGTLVLAGLLHCCHTPEKPKTDPANAEPCDRRPVEVREWERLLRARLKGAKLAVTDVVGWPNPADGEWVYVDLPDDGSVEPEQVVNACRGIAIAKQLKKGCTISVLEGEHQGAVMLEVMLRNSLADAVTLEADFEAANVYDPFQVMTAPQGDSLDVCLRQQSMVIGGAPESGKTTLLHRIILHLARCTDTLIWVVDTNGGGVGVEWMRALAFERTDRPVLDWIAADEDEAAVLVATATAIAKDRKQSPDANRRKRLGNTRILPVDERLPAIVVLNDEGGEIRQSVSVLGQVADDGLSRLAQIGRAEAVRVVKSVLRGTADLLDKGMRVNAALRICLRMEEDDEYGHVLGMPLPKGVKLDTKGAALIKRGMVDPRPVLGRTVDVPPDMIEEASVECACLRPELDEQGRQVAARLTLRQVLGGRDPAGYPDLQNLRVIRDVLAGRGYEGRWDRYAPRLASIRGEEPEPVDEAPAADAAVVSSVVAPEGSALARLLAATGVTPQPGQPVAVQPERAAVDVTDQENVDREFARLTADMPVAKLTTREHIVAILREGPLASGELGERLLARDAAVSRTYRQDVLAKLLQAEKIVQGDDGRYALPAGGAQ